MKRSKIIAALLCACTMLLCAGVFAACKDEPRPADEYYTVLMQYDTSKGTAEITPSASDEGYVKDEEVVLTVTAKTGYDVGEVKVGGAAVTLTEGKYTFKVTGNTTVVATFISTDPGPEPPPAALFPQPYIGTWSFSAPSAEAYTLTITADAAHLTVGTTGAATYDKTLDVEKSESPQGYAYLFSMERTGASPYDAGFSLTSDGYAILLDVGSVQTLLRAGFDPEELSASAPAAYEGAWLSGGGSRMQVGADGSVEIDGEPVLLAAVGQDGHATGFMTFAGLPNQWLEMTFGTNSIALKLAAGGEFTFTPVPVVEELPVAMRGEWTEYGRGTGAQTLSVAQDKVEYCGTDVTANLALRNGVPCFTHGGKTYQLGMAEEEPPILCTLSEETYTLFVKDGAPLADLKADEATLLFGRTFENETLGGLAFGADGAVTLEGEPVQVYACEYDGKGGVTELRFVAGGMLYVLEGSSLTATDLSGEEFLFEQLMTDFSAYEGAWKHFHPSNALDITIGNGKFLYGSAEYTCYVAADGSAYCRTGRFKMPFGMLDENTFYIAMNSSNYFFYSKDGNRPAAAFPEAFYGAWTDGNVSAGSRLTVGAGGVTIGSQQVTAFAVTDEGATVHAFYIGGYWIFRLAEGRVSREQPGNPQVVHYTRVNADEKLPAEYRGNWTQLGEETRKLVVDTAGNLTYLGTACGVTTDAFGNYQFTSGGVVYSLELSSDGCVIMVYNKSEGTFYCFTEDGVTLPDASATAAALARGMAGSWKAFDDTPLTVSADGIFTAGGKQLQFLTAETDSGGWIATVLWNNRWYDFAYKEGVITLQGAVGDYTFERET